MRLRHLFLVVMLLPASAQGATPAAPATAPATAPAEAGAAAVDAEHVRKLIAQLGDGDFRARERATRELVAVGKGALPLVRDALAKIDDPEVQLRLEEVIRKLTTRPLPGGPLDAGTFGRVTSHSFRVTQAEDGGWVVEVTDSGRHFRIRRGRRGEIEMTVTVVLEGKLVQEVFQAKDAEELKKESPEAYAAFERWGGGEGPVPLFQPVRPVLQPFDALKNLLEGRMEHDGTPEERRKEVLDLLNQAQVLARGDLNETAAERDRRLQAYFAASDRLRAKLTELKLPDPGEVLPPPPHGRLGIQLVPDDETLVVSGVVSGSRAERIGLRPGDVIVSVGGKRVRSLGELRAALLEFAPPITIEGLRGERAIRLVEPKEGAAPGAPRAGRD